MDPKFDLLVSTCSCLNDWFKNAILPIIPPFDVVLCGLSGRPRGQLFITRFITCLTFDVEDDLDKIIMDSG